MNYIAYAQHTVCKMLQNAQIFEGSAMLQCNKGNGQPVTFKCFWLSYLVLYLNNNSNISDWLPLFSKK